MPRYDLKAYTSLTARLPQELAEQVKRYAREHRCGLSELIRDGLEMRLEADTPWHAQGRPRVPDAEVLQEVLHLLEEVIPQQPAPARRRPGQTEVLPRDADSPGPATEGLTEVVPFDPTKYHLGKLCPRGHAYGETGQSLRSNNVAGYCLQCNVEGTRARRAARRLKEVSA